MRPLITLALAAVLSAGCMSAQRSRSLLPVLQVSFATGSTIDLIQSQCVLAGSCGEANPVGRSLAGSPIAFDATKLGATLGMLWLSDVMDRKLDHPKHAFWMMTAVSSFQWWVVAHNENVIDRIQARNRARWGEPVLPWD